MFCYLFFYDTCHAMACFEWNYNTQISGGDFILKTTFSWDYVPFCSITHYDFTIGNNVARDVHHYIIMGDDIVMHIYHDVTMHTDAARTLIYYILQLPIMIFLFS